MDPLKLPRHVAIIMDGNGRWAKKKTMNRIRGHEEGTKSVREIVRTTRELGIPWLTLYAFSEENWKRPRYEIEALMRILKRFLKGELAEMLENGIRLRAIGSIHKLPKDVRDLLQKTIEKTAAGKNLVLTLALSYGGRQELTDAMKKIGRRIKSGEIGVEQIDEQLISDSLYESGMPDPDLLIRTSGENRVSNFLLWQIAYTEFYVTPTQWPDFRKGEYLKAIEDYQGRERRFGATGEQLAAGQ
ncbi:MAG: isoprenyl transferase [Deltaproteobacteria bacterium HGW-Deltaproteobacteria-15]|jgi:undecaprenyl diphosphate synthase|nr:MAG: isoprenyl transferase [Deltaproteobacteria bacterium HGW-Deltaproteobacteria-15]